MKRFLLAVCLGSLFFVGCKEVAPDINFNATNYVDTAYMASVPASANPHNVLALEFSGQSCSNCPQGHAILDNAASANPGRVNIVTLYELGTATVLIPPNNAKYDFRDSAALAIAGSAIFNGVSSWPSADFDMVNLSGMTNNLSLDYTTWAGYINDRLPVADSLNMTVASSYNSPNGGAIGTVTVTVTYTQTVSSQQNISVAIVEDSIVDDQEQPFGVVDTNYVFNDVFVGMVSAVPVGDPMLTTTTTKSPGQFLQRVYTYTLPATFSKGNVNPAHCRVVAYVNAPGTGGNYMVYQSVQTPLQP